MRARFRLGFMLHPRAVVLSSCAEIAVVFGPAGVPATPPSSYAWNPGYGC
jgi:hypothetical protein